jgi:hypothetical protein
MSEGYERKKQPELVRRALIECEQLQSWEPLAGLLPSDEDMPRDCDDPRERFNDLDWDC